MFRICERVVLTNSERRQNLTNETQNEQRTHFPGESTRARAQKRERLIKRKNEEKETDEDVPDGKDAQSNLKERSAIVCMRQMGLSHLAVWLAHDFNYQTGLTTL